MGPTARRYSVTAMIDFFVQPILGYLGYRTARVLVPIFSFDRIRVRRPPASVPKSVWGERLLVRLPSGNIGLESEVAAFLGFGFWVAVIAIGVMLFRHAG